jgi:hypothetical protein
MASKIGMTVSPYGVIYTSTEDIDRLIAGLQQQGSF